MPPIITLTTDFGLADGFVGTMHGVILGICPAARIVDLSHGIPAQGIHEAAFVLAAAVPFFPAGTIHVVVVDPGVGSERRAIAVQTDRALYVAPDNGVLGEALAQEQVLAAVHLNYPTFWLPVVSRTFHGRDIFAPVAAHLACGVPLHELGEPVSDLLRLPVSRPERQADGTLVGHVRYIDHFGNLITDVRDRDLAPMPQVVVYYKEKRIVGLQPSYAAVPRGELVALIGSSRRLEIAVRDGSAARLLGAQVGDPLRVQDH